MASPTLDAVQRPTGPAPATPFAATRNATSPADDGAAGGFANALQDRLDRVKKNATPGQPARTADRPPAEGEEAGSGSDQAEVSGLAPNGAPRPDSARPAPSGANSGDAYPQGSNLQGSNPQPTNVQSTPNVPITTELSAPPAVSGEAGAERAAVAQTDAASVIDPTLVEAQANESAPTSETTTIAATPANTDPAQAFSADAAASIAALIASLAGRPPATLPPALPDDTGNGPNEAALPAAPLAAALGGLLGAQPAAREHGTAETAKTAPAEGSTRALPDAPATGRGNALAALAETRTAALDTPAAAALTSASGTPANLASATSALPDPAMALANATHALTLAARSEAPATPQLPVHTPAGQTGWAEDVGNRVVWMTGRGDARAELVLTPAHLGKLEISIQVSGDQTTAQFVAATSAARDALEQALPRLREVLQQAGINLGEANVSTSGDERARNGNGAGPGRGARGSGGEASGEAEVLPASRPVWTRTGLGMVDTFA